MHISRPYDRMSRITMWINGWKRRMNRRALPVARCCSRRDCRRRNRRARAIARSGAAAMLPQLPGLSGQPPAVIAHVKNADARARRRSDIGGRGRHARHGLSLRTCSTTPRPRPTGLAATSRPWRLAMALSAARARAPRARRGGSGRHWPARDRRRQARSGAGVAAARRRRVQARAYQEADEGLQPRG